MNLKKLRQGENLTQEDVAKIINKTTVAYGYYESGRNEPDLKTLIKLADFFNVSLDYLVGRQYNNQIGYVPDERKNLIKDIISLEGNQIEKLEAYVRALMDMAK